MGWVSMHDVLAEHRKAETIELVRRVPKVAVERALPPARHQMVIRSGGDPHLEEFTAVCTCGWNMLHVSTLETARTHWRRHVTQKGQMA